VELRHLRYFLAVAEEGHFGRAARRLRIAQPPVSRQIQALEEELGFPLFDRTKRRIELTAAGKVFRERARRVLDGVEEAVTAARRASLGQTGRVAVGYPSSLAYSGLTELLRAFRAHSPDVDLVLREIPAQEQITALREGRLDVGLVRAPLAEPALASEPVRTEPLVVAMPADHRLARRSRVALRDLAREPFVGFPRASNAPFFDLLIRACHDAGFSPMIVQEAPQLDIVSLVAAGYGVSLLPESVRNVPREGLVYKSLVDSPTTTLLVVWRRDDPSPVVRDFLAVVRRVLST
jgi:DNA-binding transcriptional LysR family regulator